MNASSLGLAGDSVPAGTGSTLSSLRAGGGCLVPFSFLASGMEPRLFLPSSEALSRFDRRGDEGTLAWRSFSEMRSATVPERRRGEAAVVARVGEGVYESAVETAGANFASSSESSAARLLTM